MSWCPARSAYVIARRRLILIRPKTEHFARRRRAGCPGTKRLCYCPEAVRIQFGGRPNVSLAVGKLSVQARSALSQVRSIYVIARRRRVLIRPKAERFARRRRAVCLGEKRLHSVWYRLPIFFLPATVGCLAPRGTKHPEGRWDDANLSAKQKVRRPLQALVTYYIITYLWGSGSPRGGVVT